MTAPNSIADTLIIVKDIDIITERKDEPKSESVACDTFPLLNRDLC